MLDELCRAREGGIMQNQRFLAAGAIAAALLLSACSQQPEVINEVDPMAEELKKAPPVKELPPAIASSRTYRCSDNSLFYVDFYTNNTALMRTVRGGEAVTLTAEGGNPPFTGEGRSVSGNGEAVRITAPGKNNLSCHT
jgi:hypothetical protein